MSDDLRDRLAEVLHRHDCGCQDGPDPGHVETADAVLPVVLAEVAAELRRAAADVQYRAVNPGPEEFGSVQAFAALVNAAHAIRARAAEVDREG